MASVKKPNITKGEWTSNSKGIIFHWGKGPETKGYRPYIAKVSKWKDGQKEATANQLAISAVPEMIDALTDFVESEAGPTSAANKAKNALKKAGAKLV